MEANPTRYQVCAHRDWDPAQRLRAGNLIYKSASTLMCLENEGTRGEPIHRGREPHGASSGMSRGNVHSDAGVLDVQVRRVFSAPTCVIG